MVNHSTMEARMRPRILERLLAAVADLASDDVLTETWSSHPYWASRATNFDETDLIYYLPEVFELLILLTGKKLDYVPVWCGNQLLYAVGFYRGELPFGPFWLDFKFKMKYVGGRMVRICAFAWCLQEELDVADSDRLYLWLKSFRDSNDYLTMHRLIVRRVGHLLNIDMDDHDLIKSRMEIALGFLWHWSGENDQSPHMKKMALDIVHAGHLEVEDHHPKHEKVGMGIVNVHKLLRIDSRFTCNKMHMTGMEGGISTPISYHHNIRMHGYIFSSVIWRSICMKPWMI